MSEAKKSFITKYIYTHKVFVLAMELPVQKKVRK